MKRLTDKISPLSWLIFAFASYLAIFVTLEPGLLDILLLIAVDTLALCGVIAVEKRILERMVPASGLFVGESLPTEWKGKPLSSFSRDEKIKLFEQLVAIPERMARYSCYSSFIKAIPAIVMMTFWWPYDGPWYHQFLRVVFVLSLFWSYFFGTVFIESHIFVSGKLAELHERYDWSDAFKSVSLTPEHTFTAVRKFSYRENRGILQVCLFTLCLIWIVLLRSESTTATTLGAYITLIAITGVGLATRIWYLGKSYFSDGLVSLFSALEHFEPTRPPTSFPLHTSPLLARFEMTFNTMLVRLQTYEQELSRWTFARAEQSRYRGLGEISALIVHDLSSPLHVIRFCIGQLRERPDRISDSRFLEQLTSNAERCQQLVNSLKAYLRNPTPGVGSSRFEEVYEHVLRFLELRFYELGFKRIQLRVDPRLKNLRFAVSSVDLMHILSNLLANSVENLLAHNIVNPIISVALQEGPEGSAVLRITDNGTGLTAARFEALTALAHLSASVPTSREGLGLRLIRRLVEHCGGTLHVVEGDPIQPGTTFSLRLGLKESDESEDGPDAASHRLTADRSRSDAWIPAFPATSSNRVDLSEL